MSFLKTLGLILWYDHIKNERKEEPSAAELQKKADIEAFIAADAKKERQPTNLTGFPFVMWALCCLSAVIFFILSCVMTFHFKFSKAFIFIIISVLSFLGGAYFGGKGVPVENKDS